MIRKIYCILSIMVIVLSFSVNKGVYANTKDRPLTLEECYIKMGYKTVEEAVREFEEHYKKDVMLPSMEPTIPFTHRYGLFREDKENKMNIRLDIQLLHERLFGNTYTIEIRPKENKLVFNEPGQKLYKLKNGQKALYFEHRFAFNFLVFESSDWQYILGIDKRVADKMTPDKLVEIANSIE